MEPSDIQGLRDARAYYATGALPNPTPEQRSRIKARVMQRLAWDRRLSVARMIACFLAGAGVALLTGVR